MKRCMYCGNENDDSSQNCSKCGNRLLDIQPQQVMPAEEVPDENGQADEEATKVMPEIRAAEERPEQVSPRYDGWTDLPEDEMLDDPEDDDFQEEDASQEDYFERTPMQEEDPGLNDVHRGQTYAAQQQYDAGAAGYVGRQMPYGGQQGYSYEADENYYEQPNVQQQYGGQAYGYQQRAQQYGYPPNTQGGYDYSKATAQTPGGARQVLVKARKLVRSPLFFLAVLFNTVMVVASVINVVTGNFINSVNAIQAMMRTALGSSVAVTFLNGIIDIAEGFDGTVLMLAGLVISIPAILMCLGLWLMFFQTNSAKNEISTSGCTLTRVMVVLKFIGICLVMAAALIISVAFVVAAWASSSMTSIIVGVILLLVMILISTLSILYYVQLLFGIKVIRYNLKTGAMPGKIPVFVLVAGIVISLGTVASMLPMAPNDYIGLVEKGASAAWMLFITIWTIVYRAKGK